jgi:hypothetical protein
MAQDHTFRVTHERTGKVSYEGESFIDASGSQYRENEAESRVGYPPLWRMYLVDPDGNIVRVNTQL